MSHINELEEAKTKLEEKLEIVIKEKDEVQIALRNLQEHIKGLNKELALGREKVEESINLVEAISIERNNLETNLIATQGNFIFF